LSLRRSTSLLLRFTDFADADTPYMYHCHILQHEDPGMMGQFVVVPASALPIAIGSPRGAPSSMTLLTVAFDSMENAETRYVQPSTAVRHGPS
jgi:hypothetical protein